MATHSWHTDPERDFSNPAIGLTCHIYGQAPVQADGRINRMPFYFRARHSAWSFTLCVSHEIDASTIWPHTDEPGFFQQDEFTGYNLTENYGVVNEASFMRYDEAERIIRECVDRYLREVGIAPSA